MEMAMEENVEYRQGLPLDYLTYMGVQNSDKVINFGFSLMFFIPQPVAFSMQWLPLDCYSCTCVG